MKPQEPIDLALKELSKHIYPITFLAPTNANEVYSAFMNGESLAFQYPTLTNDLTECSHILESLPVEDLPETIKDLYQEKIAHLQTEIQLIKHRQPAGISQEQLARTAALYGKPSAQLVAQARRILATKYSDTEETTELISGKEAAQLLQTHADNNNIKAHWSVSEDRTSTYVHPATFQGIIPNKPISLSKVHRLQIHENATHLHRASQGATQEYGIFQLGLAGYEATEEGLALISEIITGLLDHRTLNTYAARVLASHYCHESASLREVYNKLCQESINETLAWECALRAVRGGGFPKDHIYLQNTQELLYLLPTQQFNNLYVGKVGLQHLETITRLVREGTIKEGRKPKHILAAHEYSQEQINKYLTVLKPLQPTSKPTKLAQ